MQLIHLRLLGQKTPEIECLNCQNPFEDEDEDELMEHVENCPELEPSKAELKTFHRGRTSEARG